MSREQLIKEAKAKHEREQLIAQAKAKYAAESGEGATISAAPEMDAGSKAIQSARSMLEGATLGLSEPVMSGLQAVQQNVKHSYQQSDDFIDFLDKTVDLERLRQEYLADVGRRRGFKADNPRTAMYSEMAGAIAPMVLTMGASAPATEASLLAKSARAAAAPGEAVNLAGQGAKEVVRAIPGAETLLASKGVAGSAARITEAGVSGATQALVQEGTKRAVEGATGFIKPEDELPSLTEVVATGGVFGAGMKAVPELATQAGRAAKGAARVFTGIKSGDIDAYLERPDAIRNAKTVEQVKDEIDDTINKLRDDVDNAKISKEQARDALKQAEERVDDLVRENKNIVAAQRAEIKSNFKAAKSDLDIAFKEKLSEAKTARMPIQPDDVLDSVEKVKQQVSDLSEESYKILDLHKGKFKLSGVTRQMSTLQNDLKVNGQLLSGDAEAAYNVLGKWKEKLKAIESGSAKGLSGGEVKRIIQELDSDIRTAGDRLAGQFSDKTYQSLMGVRHLLDSKIKTQVPGYAEVMGETARMNQFRADLVKLFGRRENVTAKLARIQNPNMEFERKQLLELGKSTGKDFETPLAEYIATKGQAATPAAQDQLRRSLPQYGEYVDNLAQSARASRPEFGQDLIERARTGSPEAAAARAAQGALSASDEALLAAKGRLEPFKGITPANSENKIRTLMGDRSRKIELRRLVSSLGQISDQDFVRAIEDMRIKEVFERGDAMGSANTNMWSTIFGAVGFLSGMDPTLGIGSAAAGATFGRYVDRYGPRVTRRVLDGIVMMRGIPTVQKINTMFADLPPELRQELQQDLIRLITVQQGQGKINVPPDMLQEIAEDFDAADPLSPTEKAAAITEMNKTGSVDSATMQKMMIGTQPPPAPQPYKPTPRAAPSINQVSDFVKSRKKEMY